MVQLLRIKEIAINVSPICQTTVMWIPNSTKSPPDCAEISLDNLIHSIVGKPDTSQKVLHNSVKFENRVLQISLNGAIRYVSSTNLTFSGIEGLHAVIVAYHTSLK